MKKSLFFAAFMLLVTVCAFADDKTYSISKRSDLADANVGGNIEIPVKVAKAGTVVRVTCRPSDGYGLARGVFYATKNASGGYSVATLATPVSTYPEARADAPEFSFIMPSGDVEVWAFFTTVRVMKLHKADHGYLKALYGQMNTGGDTTLVLNVPSQPVKLEVIPHPKESYELVDVDVTGVSPAYVQKTSELITVYMPSRNDTVHVTPLFGKKNYKVTVEGETRQVKAVVSNMTPKAREEVQVTLKCEKGYIPVDFSVTGCKSWWRVGKPQRQADGGWEVTYRFKTDLQDVLIKFGTQQVYSFSVNDTKNSGRIQTYVPEMIADYPGIATSGMQVPVVFKMADDKYSASYTVAGAKSQSTMVYHNALENSFADEGMRGWRESDDYVSKGRPITVSTDTLGNKFWSTSVLNSMSQTVKLDMDVYPAAAKQGGQLNIAAIASINPRYARQAKASIVPVSTQGNDPEIVVADLNSKPEGWQTALFTGKVSTSANELQFVVQGEADDDSGQYSYGGPQFDDLCLLLPADNKSIKDEDVLLFTMDKKDVAVDYTLDVKQNAVSVAPVDNAAVTLLNTMTGERGTAVQAAENDLIVITGKANDGYAIYEMTYVLDKQEKTIDIDSVNATTQEVFFSLIKRGGQDIVITPVVSTSQRDIDQNYGGLLTLADDGAREGDRVRFTVKPNPGCKLRQIRTHPAGIVITADDVDADTGEGQYSFVMPAFNLQLIPEYIVPITTAEQIDSLHMQYGEFNLMNDIDLGDDWSQDITLYGHFNGNGHRITYGGSRPLFGTVNRDASVRHLYVAANVKGDRSYIGGITNYNDGTIEDCEVSGTLINEQENAVVSGVAGQNRGVITHCHVLCSPIQGTYAYGIAYLEQGATITDNLFNGQFADGEKSPYMISNNEPNSTIRDNLYVANGGNAGAIVYSGTAETQADELIASARKMQATWPVFAASITANYTSFTVTTSLPDEVKMMSMPTATCQPGTVFTITVRVTGNNHLDDVVLSLPDGTDAQSCPFTDNFDNTYTCTFTMPEHDVLVTFKSQPGSYIYTAQQLSDLSDMKGTYYLARDLDLRNWNKKVTLACHLYGDGHTIKYEATGSCKGLFVKVKKGAVLEHLNVIGDVVTDTDCGGITGSNAGTISDCHFSGRIIRLSAPKNAKTLIAAIAYTETKTGVIDHCSAAALLKSASSQAEVDSHPLCAQQGVTVTNSDWVSTTTTAEHETLLARAEAARDEYPVYAQGITDHVDVLLVVGSDTLRVRSGQVLDELTLADDQPFVCTGGVKVARIVYKRQASDKLQQWVLPFAFDRIAGSGTFEYHPVVENNNMPDIGPATTLSLSGTPSDATYQEGGAWMVKTDGSGEQTYVLTAADGPITVKPTHITHLAQYASISDVGNFYVTYDGIPAATTRDEPLYVWDADQYKFTLADGSADIHPYRFYVQFYSKNAKKFVTYNDTWWAKNEGSSASARAASPARRLAEAVADGWQPIILDPRQSQVVTARMLDHYEVACLADIRYESLGDDDEPLAAVSLVYQMIDSRTELPTAMPLLVRAKGSDAEPLVSLEAAQELENLLMQYLTDTLGDDTDDQDDDLDDDDIGLDLDSDALGFEWPHYWCSSLAGRLDVWPLPAPAKYADFAEYGGMLFSDNYYDQSFGYATATDARTTTPMSYAITVLNAGTYELLPLMGDRVNVQFVAPSVTTGIETLDNLTISRFDHTAPSYNLNGQRVGASYKGVVLQNGRKIIKR